MTRKIPSDVRFEKQVDSSHYAFDHYMTKARWCSVWHQLDEIHRLKPNSVLEVGPGSGILKAAGAIFGISIETLDIDPELEPDHVASVMTMPLPDDTYDVVCAFQVLEHLPYDAALLAFAELVRVARQHVLISLPDARTAWRYQFHLPKIGSFDLLVPRPHLRAPAHMPDREHFWELNKRDYPVSRIVADFTKHIQLVRSYRVRENPYHRFFVFTR